MALADVFNLKKQLVQYGSHHYNKTNIIIHMIFVPVIFWTALVFGAKTGPLVTLPSSLRFLKVLGPNLGFFTVTFYTMYYAILDPVAALRMEMMVEVEKDVAAFRAKQQKPSPKST
ncbi:hypothetical protein [Absidia glauca]|uniref:DUF962 domain-containing protein n=1 Tax=Absidia glauca TaxID=4829 RepID=A0A163KQ87_ABSGL|nr:hypothetical protein [Absidia glauca]